jgi:hypothetical protein
MVDLSAIADYVLLQLNLAAMPRNNEGVCIVLPQYLDATEIQHLQRVLSHRARTTYEITHHLGERRIWVREKWAHFQR